jgi:hypothetical protein
MIDSWTSRYLELFTSVFITAWLLSQASYAQPIPGMSPKEKADLAIKKAQEKDTDRAYNSSLKNIPDVNKSSDPWGSLRAPNPTGK